MTHDTTTEMLDAIGHPYEKIIGMDGAPFYRITQGGQTVQVQSRINGWWDLAYPIPADESSVLEGLLAFPRLTRAKVEECLRAFLAPKDKP